jgi:hypothetical protein
LRNFSDLPQPNPVVANPLTADLSLLLSNKNIENSVTEEFYPTVSSKTEDEKEK